MLGHMPSIAMCFVSLPSLPDKLPGPKRLVGLAVPIFVIDLVRRSEHASFDRSLGTAVDLRAVWMDETRRCRRLTMCLPIICSASGFADGMKSFVKSWWDDQMHILGLV